MADEIVIKKLSFIKHLLLTANQQSKLAEPQNSVSLLMYHDAIELFLDLITSKYNLNVEGFMNYFVTINQKLAELKEPPLTQTEVMRKLNKTRVALKHTGIFPSKISIQEYSLITNSFFEENTKRFFELEFDKISMIDLISDLDVKNYLNLANEAYQKQDSKKTITMLAFAFEFLLKNYESSKKNRYGQSPFFFGRDVGRMTSFSIGIDRSTSGRLVEFVDGVTESIESIQKAVKIMSFGIDYRKYIKFSLILPAIFWPIGAAEPIVQFINQIPKISKDEYEFAYNFIIECSLKIQEFDFSVCDENTRHPPLSDFF